MSNCQSIRRGTYLAFFETARDIIRENTPGCRPSNFSSDHVSLRGFGLMYKGGRSCIAVVLLRASRVLPAYKPLVGETTDY